MRIGIFTDNYFPNPYGITQSIESFRRKFEDAGHTVYVIAPRSKGCRHENSNVICFPSIDFRYKLSYPLPLPYSFMGEKKIKKLDLDIIHSQHHTLLGWTARRWARKKNIPLVFTWHTLFDQYVHFVPLVPKKWAANWIIRKAVRYANSSDWVIAPTESVKEIIREWGVTNKNISVIPSGIDEKNFLNPDRNLIRNKYGVKEDETLLFSVCRLTEEKNVKFLFESVIKVLKENQKSKFMIVSSGNLEDYLKILVEENKLSQRIIFAGIISRDEIKNYFAAGDIFVYASKSETQGMIVSEAMYMGLPVVAVDATGSKDLVENNVNGFLVNENINEFSSAVIKLINGNDLRKSMGEKSAVIAREKYTDSICANKMLDVYELAIGHKCHPKPHISC